MYTILHPYKTTIDGDTYLDAIKNFVKLNKHLNLSELIMTDQKKHWKARMKYNLADGRNKVGINVTPLSDIMLPVNLRSQIFGSPHGPVTLSSSVPTGIVSPRAISPVNVVSQVPTGIVSPRAMSPFGMVSQVPTGIVSPRAISPVNVVSPVPTGIVTPAGYIAKPGMVRSLSPTIVSPNIYIDENGKEKRVVQNTVTPIPLISRPFPMIVTKSIN